jgi:hypothetical protein
MGPGIVNWHCSERHCLATSYSPGHQKKLSARPEPAREANLQSFGLPLTVEPVSRRTKPTKKREITLRPKKAHKVVVDLANGCLQKRVSLPTEQP